MFLVGVPKGGTTTMFEILKHHPSVATGKPKEHRYWDTRKPDAPAINVENYARWLPKSRPGDCQLTGDYSPHYFGHVEAPGLLAQHLPNAKVVVLLRDPVKRIISAYEMLRSEQEKIQHRAKKSKAALPIGQGMRAAWSTLQECDRQWNMWGTHPATNGSSLLRARPASFTSPSKASQYERCVFARGDDLEALTWSLYKPSYERWAEAFPPASLLFLSSEEFFNDPEAGMALVVDHFDLPPFTFHPELIKTQIRPKFELATDDMDWHAPVLPADRALLETRMQETRDWLATWGRDGVRLVPPPH